jgi:hypothetical protein
LKRCYKNIAIILFGIFIFPIVFQYAHIITYHSNSFSDIHHESCCQTNENHSGINKGSVVDKNNHCVICEYEFSFNEIPVKPVIGVSVLIIKANTSEATIASPIPSLSYKKSPRAPPALARA